MTDISSATTSPGTGDGPPEMSALDTDLIGDLGANRATVLLHGAAGDKLTLRPLAEALSPELSILPSLRGHGASVDPGWGFSPLDFAADLQRMAHRWPRDLAFVGYSFGAVVAAVSAATWAAPRVSRLVVLDTGFGAYPELHENDEWAEASWLRWTYDYRPVLAALRVPVLVVRTEHSTLLDEAATADLEALPMVTLRTAPGDHDSVLGAPHEIARLIGEWDR